MYGDGTGRTSTAKQTTPIVTKPSQNANASIPVKNRTAPVQMTDTGTGSYTSSNNAAKNATRAVSNNAINGYKGNANTPTSSGTSIAPSTARPAVDIQTALSRSCAGSRKVTQVGNQIVYNGKIYNIPSGSPVVNWTPEMVERYLNSGLPVKISLLSLTPDSIKPYQIPEIHALGAGDYSSDTKGALLMTSGIEVVAGAGIIIFGTGGIGAAVLIAAGAASAIGGIYNEYKGGSFEGGWLGGEVSGAVTGIGLGYGGGLLSTTLGGTSVTVNEVIGAFVAAQGIGAVGGAIGGFYSSIINQLFDSDTINFSEAKKEATINGFTAGVMSIMSPVPGSIGAVSPIIEATIDVIIELMSDSVLTASG